MELSPRDQQQGSRSARTTKRLGNLAFGLAVMVITACMMADYGWKAGLAVLLFVLAAVLVSVALGLLPAQKRRRRN